MRRVEFTSPVIPLFFRHPYLINGNIRMMTSDKVTKGKNKWEVRNDKNIILYIIL